MDPRDHRVEKKRNAQETLAEFQRSMVWIMEAEIQESVYSVYSWVNGILFDVTKVDAP